MLTKPNQTSFKKGRVTNPSGRPKGSLNVSTKKFAKIKSLASERYDEAFAILWKNMEIGEGWAHQIFFKELVPKKVHQPIGIVAVKEGESRLEALIKGLSDFEELTHEEILNEIKVLNIKQSELDLIINSKAEQDREEDLMAKVYAIGRAIDYQEKLNKKKENKEKPSSKK